MRGVFRSHDWSIPNFFLAHLPSFPSLSDDVLYVPETPVAQLDSAPSVSDDAPLVPSNEIQVGRHELTVVGSPVIGFLPGFLAALSSLSRRLPLPSSSSSSSSVDFFLLS